MAISAIALTSAVSVAQTRIIEHEYSEFDAISVSDGFKVTLVEKDGYNAKFKVSDALESYLECYVKAGTLYIGLDDKSIPKEVKKSFKGKNSDGPVLEATIYVSSLNSITLNDDCTFSSSNSLNSGKFKEQCLHLYKIAARTGMIGIDLGTVTGRNHKCVTKIFIMNFADKIFNILIKKRKFPPSFGISFFKTDT